MTDPGDALSVLASILRTSPATGAVAILGQLLDSLPIGFYVTDCSENFVILYANRVWTRWITPRSSPLIGSALRDVFPGAGSGLLGKMRNVCLTAQPQHVRGFDFAGLSGAESSWPGGATRMDWAIHPLTRGDGRVSHLLNVVITGQLTVDRPSSVGRESESNRLREEAEGVLRIFGVAPPRRAERRFDALTEREREISSLIAMGLTNRTIAGRLHLSPATVSSHVSHILAKQHFRSRAQIATWVVERQLRRQGQS